MGFGFAKDGRHSSEFDIVMKSDNRTLLAAKRVSKETVLGKHGSYYFEDAYENKPLSIICKHKVRNLELRRKKSREIALWLSTEGKLIFDDEPDKYYLARLDNAIDLSVARMHDEFKLNFECYPFALSEAIKIKRENITTDSKMLVTNQGTFESKPFIIINGTADAVTFTGPTWAFSITSITEKVYIDTEKMIVYTIDTFGKKQNKMTNSISDVIESICFDPGTTTLDISGTNMNVNIEIELKYTWL